MNILKQKISNYLKVYKRYKFPNIVMIQTTPACNGKCVLCPHPQAYKKWEQRNMEDELFVKIIDECAQYPPDRISLYWNNEPLLDKKIIPRLEYVRKQCNPKTKLHLSTNATNLYDHTAKGIASLVDYIHISLQGGITNQSEFEKYMPGLNYRQIKENLSRFINLISGGGTN